MVAAEGDVFPQRQIEHNAVLKYEADLPVQGLFVVGVDRLSVVGDGARRGLQQSDQQVKKLRLARGRGTDDGGPGSGLGGERDILQDQLLAERQRDIVHGDIAVADLEPAHPVFGSSASLQD